MRHGLKSPVARELNRETDFQKGTFDLRGRERNVLIRDKISFVGVEARWKIWFVGAVSLIFKLEREKY